MGREKKEKCQHEINTSKCTKFILQYNKQPLSQAFVFPSTSCRLQIYFHEPKRREQPLGQWNVSDTIDDLCIKVNVQSTRTIPPKSKTNIKNKTKKPRNFCRLFIGRKAQRSLRLRRPKAKNQQLSLWMELMRINYTHTNVRKWHGFLFYHPAFATDMKSI